MAIIDLLEDQISRELLDPEVKRKVSVQCRLGIVTKFRRLLDGMDQEDLPITNQQKQKLTETLDQIESELRLLLSPHSSHAYSKSDADPEPVFA